MTGYMILQPFGTGFYLPVIGAVNNISSTLIIFAGLIFYQFRTKYSFINHELHFYGALAGALITLAIFHPF